MNEKLLAFRRWWSSLSQREQRLLSSLVVLTMVLVFIFALWKPLIQSKVESQNAVNRERQLLDFVVAKANDVISLRQQTGTTGAANQPLNQIIATTSSELNISLIRIQPREDELQVWVAPLPFNQLLNWIDRLSAQYGVRVVALDIERNENSGIVDVRRLQFK